MALHKFSEDRTEALLKKHGIPYARHYVAKNADSAVRAAGKLGYPVVLKVESDDVLHKTETGGVAVDIRNEKEVRSSYEKVIKNVKKKAPKARIKGILVQHMCPGREVIVGARRDPQFGPVIMFGLGGVFVEVMKDVSFRLLPASPKEIKEMISEIKGYPVLKGVRGQRPVHFPSLENVMLGVSRLMAKNSSIQEMDLNPVMTDHRGAVAVDARILGS